MTLPLVLASSSPFRRMLMENAGLSFDSRAAEIDERAIEAGLENASPDETALTLARAKAIDVARHFPGAIVIGSDQTMSWVTGSITSRSRAMKRAKACCPFPARHTG